jgi:hypothetical protein
MNSKSLGGLPQTNVLASAQVLLTRLKWMT